MTNNFQKTNKPTRFATENELELRNHNMNKKALKASRKAARANSQIQNDFAIDMLLGEEV